MSRLPGVIACAVHVVLILTCLALFVPDTQAQAEEPKRPAIARESAAEAKIRQALDEETTVEFLNTPLSEACQSIAQRHNIQITLHARSLEDSGVQSDSAVTANYSQVRLKSALKLMLEQLELSYLIRHDVLHIVSQDEADAWLETRVYDVRDLLEADAQQWRSDGDDLGFGSGSSYSTYDFDSLIAAITSTVNPTSWDDVGGPGSIVPLYANLVVSQTQPTHEQIVDLLADLRKIQANRPIVPAATKKEPTDPQQLVLRIYWLSVAPETFATPAAKTSVIGNLTVRDDYLAGTPAGQAGVSNSMDQYLQQLVKTIPDLIEQDSWQSRGGNGIIRAMPSGQGKNTGAILVRQTPAVHAKIVRLLKELGQTGESGQGGNFSVPTGGGGFF